MKKRGTALLCLIPALLLSGCALLPQEEELAPLSVLNAEKKEEFEFAYVTRGDLELWESVTCKFQSLEQEHLCFQYDGRPIGEIFVEVGDEVEPGQLLAELENEELDKELEEAQIRADRLAEELQYAKNSLEIVYDSWDLYDQAEDYEKDVAQKEQDSALADKRLEELTAQKRKESLYAGIKGTVTYISDYEMSDTKRESITVADRSKACFYADTKFYEAMKPGMEVTLTTDEGELLAVVTKAEDLGFDPPEVKDNGERRVYFVPQTEAAMLNDTSKAQLELLMDSRRDVLIVPGNAVFFAGEQAYAFYEDENGVRAAKPVELGLQVRGKYEVLSGLDEGEALVIG